MNKYTNQSKWHRLEKQNCSLHRITAKHRSTSKLRAYTRNVNIIFPTFPLLDKMERTTAQPKNLT